MDYIKQKCPLCEHPAKYYLVDHGNRKYFRCEKCTDFQVYINAEEMLAATPKEWKGNASKASRNSDKENVLFISTNNDELRGEFKDRETLPLS